MLPTFNLPTNASTSPLTGATNSLLPGEAVEPVAAFATEMKLFRTIPVSPPETGEFLPPGVVAKPGTAVPELDANLRAGGELLPPGGKELPAELRAMLDELRGPDADGGPPTLDGDALSVGAPIAANVPVLLTERPIYVDAEVELPPGLNFETRLTALPENRGGIAAENAVSTAARGVEAAVTASTQPPAPIATADTRPAAERQAAIDRLAALAAVPADKLAAVVEQRGVSTPNLQRIADYLADRQKLPEQAVAAAAARLEALSAAPRPAPTARIDGAALDAKSQRLRPIGVGQPLPQPSAESRVSPTVVELDVEMPVLQQASQPRADVVAAEGLRAEAMLNAKPAPGGFQIAAPQQGPTVSSTSPTLQPVDTGGKPLPGSIDVPVRDASWGDRLNERVVMMANNRLQNVDLRLSPAELGPLRVKVSVEDGTASVSFVAQHAVTRDAIEQALPRLRTLLEQNGIDLGNTSVDQHSPEQGAAHAEADGGDASGPDDAPAAERMSARDGIGESESDGNGTESVVRLSRGLLDTFA